MQNDAEHIPIAEESLKRRHESVQPRLRNVVIAVVSVVVMTVICFGVVQWMMAALAAKRPTTTRPVGYIIAPDTKPLEVTTAPHLQIDEHANLETFRAHEEDELNSYGWIDRTAGVMRIPVERAMDIIATRGLPQTTNIATHSDLELIRERSQNR